MLQGLQICVTVVVGVVKAAQCDMHAQSGGKLMGTLLEEKALLRQTHYKLCLCQSMYAGMGPKGGVCADQRGACRCV